MEFSSVWVCAMSTEPKPRGGSPGRSDERSYDVVLFAKTLGVALGLLFLIAALGIFGGVAYAVPVSGVGEYQVSADHIEATDVVVHPQMTTDGEIVAVIELRETEIEGLEITKRTDGMEMVVSAEGPVESEEMLIRAKDLEAVDSDLSGVEIDANSGVDSGMTVGTGQDMENGETVQFGDAGEGNLVLEDFSITTTYLVTNQISIEGLSLEVDDGSDIEDEG